MSRFQWLPIGSPFEEKPFRRVFERVRRPLPPDPEIVTAYTDGQVTLRSNRSKEGYHEAADLSGFQGVEVGDFVVHGLDILRGSVGVADSAGALSSVCIVCVPRVESDPRFFAYAMRAQAWAGVPRALAKGVREGGADFRRWETLADLPLPVPSLPEQRVIADHLDAETTRIDALIFKKHRMLQLLDERSQALHDEWYQRLSSEYGLVPIRRLAHEIEQGWSPVCDSEPANHDEWGVIQTSAVSSGRFRIEHNKKLPPTVERNTRWLLRDGDLLVTRGSGTRSKVGRACVASVESRILTLSDLVYRVKLIQAEPKFVSAALQGSPVRAQIESSIRTDVGLTLKIRRDDLADIQVPAVPRESQAWETASLARVLKMLQDSILGIKKQVNLLAERQQALIATVTTGERSVPGMAD